MRKLVTLFAAATLVVSSIAWAEEVQLASNPNDVLQTLPQNNAPENMNLADASSTTTPAMDSNSVKDTNKANKATKPKKAKKAKKRVSKHQCNHCQKTHRQQHNQSNPANSAQANEATPA